MTSDRSTTNRRSASLRAVQLDGAVGRKKARPPSGQPEWHSGGQFKERCFLGGWKQPRSATGLVQQTDQIAAARDLSLFVRFLEESVRTVATKENRIAILAMAKGTDVSCHDIMEKTGCSYWVANRSIATLLKNGDLVTVLKAGGGTPGRYTAAPSRSERAEEIIYRLLDRLMDMPLDADAVALCREAGQFIKLGDLHA